MSRLPQEAAAQKMARNSAAFGFDTDSGMDTSVCARRRFLSLCQRQSGRQKREIPADKSNYGMFTALDDLSKERVKLVLEAEKDVKGSKAGRCLCELS